MNKLVGVIGALLLCAFAFPDASAKGGGKGSGKSYSGSTSVKELDNRSTKGNTNLYTGKVGTQDLFNSPWRWPIVWSV